MQEPTIYEGIAIVPVMTFTILLFAMNMGKKEFEGEQSLYV